MKKKTTALLLAAVLAVGMTACTGSQGGSNEASKESTATAQSDGGSETELKKLSADEIKAAIRAEAEANGNVIELKLWASDLSIDAYRELAHEFTELYEGPSCEIKINIVENNADKSPAKLIEDTTKAADIIPTTAAGLPVLAEKNCISAIEYGYYEGGTDLFIDEAVNSVTVDGRQYAYPVNYSIPFLVYDKQIYTDPADISSLDSLISKANENGKKFYFCIEDPWLGTAFLMASGTPMSYKDGVQTIGYDTDEAFNAFRSVRDYGKLVGSGLETGSSYGYDAHVYIDDEFAGLIRSDAAAGQLPANIGVAKLPTVMINGEQKQLESFGDLYCLAINKDTKYPKTAQALAAFLSSPESLKRISENVNSAVPLKEYEDTEVIKAVMEQLPYVHAQSETVGSTYWGSGIGDFFAKLLKENGNVTDERIKNGINKQLMGNGGMDSKDW